MTHGCARDLILLVRSNQDEATTHPKMEESVTACQNETPPSISSSKRILLVLRTGRSKDAETLPAAAAARAV